MRIAVISAAGCLLLFSARVLAQEQSSTPQRGRAFTAVRFRSGLITKVDPTGGVLTVKETVQGQGQERSYQVTKETVIIKEGKEAKLEQFKEGQQILLSLTRRREGGRRVVRQLADPVTFCAFLLYPTVKGTVKSFDPAKLTVTVAISDKEEKTFTLPGRGICCFLMGKGHRGREAALKGGESVVVVLSGPSRARAVFDQDSWRAYGESQWSAVKARRERRRRPTTGGQS